MLPSLHEMFLTNQIEVDSSGKKIPIHSHTPQGQGLFLQKIFDLIKPEVTLEVGLAYGISALFILEMHKNCESSLNRKHIVIEPDDYWGYAAMHNIEKEGLSQFVSIHRAYSDQILPRLYHDGQRIQYAYIDTTKRFEVVFQDFYFINKILDVGGVIIFDDTGGSWPGVQRVARYISCLPHYQIFDCHGEIKYSFKKRLTSRILSTLLSVFSPFKKLYPTFNFKSDLVMGLNYRCIAFKKVAEDNLPWSWDKSF